MARRPTVQVRLEEIRQVYQALEIWDKIRDGRLESEEIPSTRVSSHAWPGGTSVLLRHPNSPGLQVATTHRIYFPTGDTPYWTEKDLLVGDIVLYRPDVKPRS